MDRLTLVGLWTYCGDEDSVYGEDLIAKLNIKKAIKRPGQLHKDLGIPMEMKIPNAKLMDAMMGKFGEKTAQRARLAKTMKSFK